MKTGKRRGKAAALPDRRDEDGYRALNRGRCYFTTMNTDLTTPRRGRRPGRGACPSLYRVWADPTLDGWGRLRLSVVAMAAEDAKRLVEKNAEFVFLNGDKVYISREEVRQFFQSPLCALYLRGTSWNGPEIMERCGL